MNNFNFMIKYFFYWVIKKNPIFEMYLKGRLVLDVGCGEGEVVSMDKDNFFGIDINKKAISRCLNSGLNVKFGEVDRIPFGDNFFDVVYCSNVIEHLSPIKARNMIIEMKRVLKNGGIIIIITPMPKTVWNTFGHIKPYPPAALKKILRPISLESFDSISGLRIDVVFYYGSWSHNKVVFLLSTLLANIFPILRSSHITIIKKYE